MPYRKPFQARSKATAKSKTKPKAVAAKKSPMPAKALPVTLLSGFLVSSSSTGPPYPVADLENHRAVARRLFCSTSCAATTACALPSL